MQTPDDPVGAVAALDEPTRRRLYDYIARSRQPVGRDQAARALGIARVTAAFHLDRLAAQGLLEVSHQRLTGRSGPGAGRPAKLYRRAGGEVAVALPPRHYDLAGALLAEAIETSESLDVTPREALAHRAREHGAALARPPGRSGRSRRPDLDRTIRSIPSRSWSMPGSSPTRTTGSCGWRTVRSTGWPRRIPRWSAE